MTGNIPHYEISDRASRLHIDPEEKRILFLIEGKHFDETSGAILKNLLSCRSKTYIVPLTETLLAVIRPLCQNETFEDMRHIAEEKEIVPEAIRVRNEAIPHQTHTLLRHMPTLQIYLRFHPSFFHP